MTKVYGIDLDKDSRCRHYHSVLDIVAIKFKCCNKYYACDECHTALEPHLTIKWKKNEQNQKAILCGQCKSELSIDAYLKCDNQCPRCSSPFNPGCKLHYSLYFEEV